MDIMLASTFHIALIVVVFLLILVGIVLVPLTLPGTWLIVAAGGLYAIFFSFDGGATSAWWVIAWLIGVAAFGEIVEFGVGTLGGKAVKVSNGAIVSAFIGGIIGLFIGVPIFLIGSLIGLFIGAFLGAFIYEMVVLKSFGRAFVTACAVLATRLVASLLKVMLAIGMGIFLGFKIF